MDRDPGALGFRWADRRAIVSVEDEPAVHRLAVAEHVDGIIAPGIDFPVAIAARVASHHNLPHPLPPAVAQLATSKLRQRERFADAGVPTAPYHVCTSLGDVRQAALALGLPVVVKPPDRQGQRGVSAVHDRRSLEPAFEVALDAARSGVVLVERMIHGPELTVNAFSVEGRFHALTVTDRVVSEGPAFGIALAHVWPSRLPGAMVERAIDLARAAADALGVRDGPTYTQVLLGEEGHMVGELAARLGNGHDAELCVAAIGIDLNDLAIDAALGDEIDPDALVSRQRVGGACVRFLVAPEGTLEAVEGLEEARAAEGVGWVEVYREAGFDVPPLRGSADRAGALLATGATRDEALARSEAAAGRVRFRPVDVHAAAASS